MTRKLALLIAAAVLLTAAAPASAADCSKRVPISKLFGVLYKPENLHGARGPTFLVQNVIERTKKRKIEIRDIKCKVISKFGLYATDYPYGARYYQKSGGGNHSDKQLYRMAKLAGSSLILVEGAKGKWIEVPDPRKRAGTIYGDG